MAKINGFIKKREIITGQLTRFQTYIDSISSINNPSGAVLSELDIRLSTVRPLLEEFNLIQYEIDSIQTKAEEVQANVKERDSFEKLYFEYLAIAQTLVNKYNPRGSSQSSSAHVSNLDLSTVQLSQVKLPTIGLPVFAGNYENWLEFRDIFDSLIHANNSIGDVQKFHYLKASLKGEAIQIIQSLQLCDANYAVAWSALLERYDNKRLIVYNHVRSLFNLPSLSKESHVLLRQLLDGISSHLRSLKTLGQPVDQWDTLLIYVIANKFDATTKREWEAYKIEGEFPTMDNIKTFLRKKCELLETLSLTQSNDTKVNSKPKFSKQSNYSSSNAFLATNNDAVINKTISCAFCKKLHNIYQCEEFQKLPTDSRIAEVKNRKLCFNCLRESHSSIYCRKPTRCRECKRKHHTLLHLNTQRVAISNTEPEVHQINAQVTQPSPIHSQGSSLTPTISNHVLNDFAQQVLLSTAIVQVQDKGGVFHNCRALLDSGSQSNFITQDLCDLLGLRRTEIGLAVSGINQIATEITHKVEAIIQSNCDTYKSAVACLVIPKITGNIPNMSFNPTSLQIPKNIKLADSTFNISDKIDLLIGAQIFWSLICIGQIKLGNSQLLLQKTRFGWVLAGPLNLPCKISNKIHCNFSSTRDHPDVQEQLVKFWELEECQNKKALSQEENHCEEHFINTIRRGSDGRFFVSIPLKGPIAQLGDSKELATKRFYSLERALNKNLNRKQQYVAFMNEYESMGHMTRLKDIDCNPIAHYLPHHGVIKEDSTTTKLRVVFDGSAKTSTGVSINDLQMVGPVVQDDLFSILIRFRKQKYVLSSDIAKMYRQVFIHPDQRNLQRIVWRSNPSDPLDHYVLNTVTYGTAAASFLAIRSLQQLGHESAIEYPRSSQIILRDFYVDDLLTGADSIEDAVNIQNEITIILRRGCFELRKWVSNEPQILEGISNSSDSNALQLCPDGHTKTLGLSWLPKSDTLSYNIKVNEVETSVTKRGILSSIAKIFDPLGLLAPSIIIPKILLQKLWQYKLSWDESLPMDLHTRWLRFRNEIGCLQQIQAQRRVILDNAKSIELHGFSDASEAAYGASVYIRSVDTLGNICVKLACAKSKVAPLKSVSIPRLELCGALLLARLVHKTKTAMNVDFDCITYWCDSTVALGWIKTTPNTLKTFVANRVAEIQSLAGQDDWRHVRSGDNPADLLSRGINPKVLIASELWWNGPCWLTQLTNHWPTFSLSECQNSSLYLSEQRQQTIGLIVKTKSDLFQRFSSLNRFQRCIAYGLRFKANALKLASQRNVNALSVEELNHALQVIIKLAQREEFEQEIADLTKKQNINVKSKLLSLNPFIDNQGILRVGGRIQNSNFSEYKKHPALLPAKHKLTLLIVKHEHERTLHAGPQTLLAALRENYWPISGRSLAKQVVHNCVTCFHANPKPTNQLMGSLPKDRVTPSSPFQICGVDYCGPILIKDRKGRGCKTTKAYICIFICFATKAIHLVLVSELTTEAFLASLRRFSARRGKPSKIYSDNGTNFVGANAALRTFLFNLDAASAKDNFENVLSAEGISWKFIPPRSPHFGGLWEAGVKSIKYHLKRVTGNALFTYEELYTVLTQIEAVVNSRPLSPLSSDPNDLNPITPAHFLIGRNLVGIPEHNIVSVKETRLSRFQRVQQVTQHFWGRWSKEYISELQRRPKWKTNGSALIQTGSMVIIREDNVPPLKWRLGRIVQIHPGPDGIVRVVSVKCNSGVQKRATSKICVLPID